MVFSHLVPLRSQFIALPWAVQAGGGQGAAGGVGTVAGVKGAMI